MDVSRLTRSSFSSIPSSETSFNLKNLFAFDNKPDSASCDDLKVKSRFNCRFNTAKTMNLVNLTKKFCSLKNPLIREFLAEILCTFLLISFGLGACAQFVLGKKDFNSYLSVNFAWGTAVTLSILVGGKISGAHMNPAVSLSMLLMGNLSIYKFSIYIIGQCIGALLGSVLIYVVYLDALTAFDGGVRQMHGPNATAGIWATYPNEYLSVHGAFFDQFFATAILILCCLAISDPKNHEIRFGVKALVTGNVVFMIGLSFGMNCGYAINPVRDFIPRLFTSFSGWGLDVFKAHNYFFWIPILAPLLGSVFATFLYAFMIGNHWPHDQKHEKHEKNEIV